MSLVAVQGDPNSHGDGNLICSNNDKIFIGGKKIAIQTSNAGGDNQSHPTGATDAATGSSKVFGLGKQLHRHGDLRNCGATTISQGQTKVTCG